MKKDNSLPTINLFLAQSLLKVAQNTKTHEKNTSSFFTNSWDFKFGSTI
jgi:hypothetical protein